MEFETALRAKNLKQFFLDSTAKVASLRLLRVQRCDVDDAIQDVRVSTLRTLADAVEKRVERGESEKDATDAVLTREFIASVASRHAKRYVRRWRDRRRNESLDEVAPIASHYDLSVAELIFCDSVAALSPIRRQICGAALDGFSLERIARKTKKTIQEITQEIALLQRHLDLRDVIR